MSDADIQKTAELLSKFKPGFLPYPVFEQIARLVALPILEYIPLRVQDGRIEVLLIERSAEDPHWPGMLHTPGTVIRATDLNQQRESNWPAMERILQEELQGTKVSAPHYVGSILHESKRGTEQAQLYWVEVLDDNPPAGKLYLVDALPDKFIESQRAFVCAATESFKRHMHV